MKKIIWFDMDGTIADLYAVENWLQCLCASDESPYQNARPMVNMNVLARYLNKAQKSGWAIGIISWGSKYSTEDFLARVDRAKREWLHKHLRSVNFNYIHIVHYGTSKFNTCGGGILFDDEERNRNEWKDVAYTPTDIFEVLKNLKRI